MKKAETISRPPLAQTSARTVAALRLLIMAALFLLAVGIGFSPAAEAQNAGSGILLGDFNNDGIPDALVPSPSTRSFTLSFGTVPFGTFNPVARSVPYPNNCNAVQPGETVVGDFNGDGLADLAFTCDGAASSASNFQTFILLGAGDGTFTTAATTLTGLTTLVAADFNHDGKLDLLAAGSNGMESLRVLFYPGNGDGTFAAATTTTIATAYTAAQAVDLDSDGYPDLVLGNFGSQTAHTLDIFANNHNGTFGIQQTTYVPTTTINVGAYPASTDTAILSGSFFGTGLTDLAVVDTGTTPGVFLIKNNSTDGFAFAAPAKTAYAALQNATAASFTSALSDLLVYDGAKLTVLANDGAGSFTAGYAGLSLANTSGIFAAADANGDGHADIYTAALTATGASLAVNLVSGSASAKSSAVTLPAGTVPIAASWPGNINFVGKSLTGSEAVTGFPTSITLVSSKNPSSVGDSVTFTATVAPATSGSHLLSGTVTFLDRTAALGTATLGTGGVATLTTTALTAGPHNINAAYSGDNFFGASSPAMPLVQTVISAPTIRWATPAAISYGTALTAAQLNATAVSTTGAAIPGTFVYTPAAGTVLAPGTQTLRVAFTPADLTSYTTATGTVSLVVNKAVPVITWATPASIPYGTPLSAAQLDATAAGISGAPLPGTFVYTPAAGTVLAPGAHTLSAAFTPTDGVDYATGTGTVQLMVSDVTITSFTPNTAVLGDPAKTITVTGSGIVSTTVVQVNATAIATTVVNATTLTAVIPASDFLAPGTLQITLKNPATGSVSPPLGFTVTAPPASATLTAPAMAPAGTQPALTFTLTPYPVDVLATLTLTQKSSLSSGVTDPMVLFSGSTGTTISNGGKSISFTIPAGTTTVPVLALQAGTVAEVITVVPVLTVDGVDVTPESLQPAVIEVPASVPVATATTLARNGDQLVVTFHGYSNTREVLSAKFHFVAANGEVIDTTDFTPPVADLFTAWYADPDSEKEGSSFTYTQNFTINNGADKIDSVQITLTNTIGTSDPETAQ